MRRGKPLRRGGPLARHAPLVARSELTRRQPLQPTRDALRRVPFRPQRPTVTPQERRARKLVRARSGGLCEIGWVCDGAPATDYAHRQSRAQGGPFDPANAGDACRDCHRRCHDQPAVARSRGWSVRRGRDVAAVPVLHARHGWVWLGSDGSITREAA